jgi:hypothetical protein
MGAGTIIGDSGIKFVATRNLGSFEDAESDGDSAIGDQREIDGTTTGDSSGGSGGGRAPVDPGTLGSDAPYGYTPTGRRKRAPGGKRNTNPGRTARESSKVSNDLTEILAMIHWGLAVALKTPEIELTPEEAAKLGESVARVTELYADIPGMDEKTMAWVKLGGTAATIYGTRIMAAKMRKKKPVVFNAGLHNVG